MPIGLYAAIIPVAIIAILFLWSMKSRGTLIVCPECEARFKRPAFAEKSSGLGFTLPGIGNYTCPKCNYRSSTSSFRKAEGTDSKI